MSLRTNVLLSLLLVGALLPVSVGAQGVRERENTVCELRSQRANQVQSVFSEKQIILEERMSGVLQSVEIRRHEIDEVTTQTQQEFSGRYEQWHAAYLERNADEAKQAAANTFYEQLQNLLTIRQEAVTAARNSYRTQIDQIRAQRHVDIQQEVSNFKKSSDTGFRSLGDACGDRNRNNSEVRTKFIENLQSSRLAYAEKRRNHTSYKDQMQEAVSVRKKAYNEAKKSFEQGFQEAISNLRVVDSEL